MYWSRWSYSGCKPCPRILLFSRHQVRSSILHIIKRFPYNILLQSLSLKNKSSNTRLIGWLSCIHWLIFHRSNFWKGSVGNEKHLDKDNASILARHFSLQIWTIAILLCFLWVWVVIIRASYAYHLIVKWKLKKYKEERKPLGSLKIVVLQVGDVSVRLKELPLVFLELVSSFAYYSDNSIWTFQLASSFPTLCSCVRGKPSGGYSLPL